jgi:tetratricopeptide (TPR) repeat protein
VGVAGSAGRHVRLGLALVIGWFAVFGAVAQDIQGYPRNVDAFDRREVALLPKFCPYTQLFRTGVPGGNNQQLISAWSDRMGPVFHDMHHYCFGLMKTHRGLYLSRDANTRNFYLNDALSEFDYVIVRAPETFVMLPEIVSKKGEVLVQLGRGPLAVMEFERAIELKPDFWPPYAHLGDYYKGVGNMQKAREVLETGLARAPDAKALQRRLAELKPSPGRSSTP